MAMDGPPEPNSLKGGTIHNQLCLTVSPTPQPVSHKEDAMKKLTLNVDDLRVESFSSLPAELSSEATVQGHAMSRFKDYCSDNSVCVCHSAEFTCLSCNGTCDVFENTACNGSCDYTPCVGSCNGSCFGTCDATCDNTCTCDPWAC